MNEIDYGRVEGMDINDLMEKFPNIVSCWKKRKIKVSGWKSESDVLIRSRKFLKKTLSKDKNCLIITHLVVLRMIIYHYLKYRFF